MGAVYLAEQENPRRTVALKVIRPGSVSRELLRRFEHEAQVLGRLQHPGIAQIHEAGTADLGGGPQPFFAMELIRGAPLLQFAKEQRLGTRQRLELMARICDAVEHAHQNAVIHRDLKPGNILVDPTVPGGQPKILDFGVARATDVDLQTATLRTDVGQLVGTVPYMSPEQATGDPDLLDTRSDVYALGVICYELLAGRLPYDLRRKVIAEAVLVIRHEDPARLSSINPVFRGDVETIVGKALEKDRSHRYQSAAALASDLRCYLADLPISARPPSVRYQLQKLARRHKTLVAGVLATFVVVLAGGAVSGWQAIRATRAERDARENLRQTRIQAAKFLAVSEFLQEMLASANPSRARGRELTVREILDDAAARIEGGSVRGEPEVEASVRATLGTTYHGLGLYDVAERHLRAALALRLAQPGEGTEDVPGLRLSLADLLHAKADYRGAAEQVEHALAEYRSHPEESLELAHCLDIQAKLAYVAQDLAKAQALHERVLSIRRKLLGENHGSVASSLHNLAFLARARRTDQEAERLSRAALDVLRRVHGPDHPDIVAALNNLAEAQEGQGNSIAAEATLREALEVAKRVTSDEHPAVANVLWRLGSVLEGKGDYDAAEPLQRRALALRRKALGGEHPDVALSMVALARTLNGKGDNAGAEALMVETLELRRKLLGPDHTAVASSLQDLGDLMTDRRQYDKAEPLLREALGIWRKHLGQDHPDSLECQNILAITLQNRGKLEESEAVFQDALDRARRQFGDDSPRTAKMVNNLAGLLYRRGRKDGVESMYREALAVRKKHLARGHRAICETLGNLAYVLEARGDWAAAEPFHREAWDQVLSRLSADHPEAAGVSRRLCGNLLKQKKWPEAEAVLREYLVARQRKSPPDEVAGDEAIGQLVEALVRQEKLDEAERLVLDVHARVEALPQAKLPGKRKALERIVRFYRSHDREEDARHWQEKLEELRGN
jgi:tetratricopeptide (TPR) repeat protein